MNSINVTPSTRTICLALTGASGMLYGFRLLEYLLESGCCVQLIYSRAAQIVAQQEQVCNLPSHVDQAKIMLQEKFAKYPGQLEVYGREAWSAPMASGSNPPDAMVICPCSMGCLAAVAQGLADNLIERAADVALKENKTLVLVPRESPFSVIHLENMLRLARAGAIILPPNPGFYDNPESVQDLVDFVVARILDHLQIKHRLSTRWGEKETI